MKNLKITSIIFLLSLVFIFSVPASENHPLEIQFDGTAGNAGKLNLTGTVHDDWKSVSPQWSEFLDSE